MTDAPDYLLVSDVDGTLLGPTDEDHAALRTFVEWFDRHRTGDERLGVVLSSGRFPASILDSVRDSDLPTPDGLIGGVGTEIRLRVADGDDFEEPFAAWTDSFEEWDAGKVRDALADTPGLEDQPAEFQSPHKVSYYYRDASEGQVSRLARSVADAGIPARVVYSSDRDLDVLPAAADKGNAAKFLAAHLGVPFRRVIVAGDSGNDAAMFTGEFRGVVVANALPELRGVRHTHVYKANARCAAGVLEGVRYWTGWGS